MIRKLQLDESCEEIRKELDHTQQRLLKDTRTGDLAPPVSALLARLDALANESGGDAGPEELALQALVDQVNEARCRLFGELTARACTHGLNPNWATSFFRQARAPQTEVPPKPTRRGPNSIEDWLSVATERGDDARANLDQRPGSVGPVYMAGYAIECSLKALLRAKGKPFPTSRSAGHDIQGLWEASGFRLSDLRDSNGAKAFFIEEWSTDLRYETTPPERLPAQELLMGAGNLTGWIQTHVRRARGRR